MKKFELQRGFLFGVAAIALIAIATGFVVSNRKIAADSSSKNCLAGSNTTVEETVSSSQEQALFGSNVQTYNIKDTSQHNWRLAIGAQEVTRAGNGGTVKFTVGLQNRSNEKLCYKLGRVELQLEGNKHLSFYFGSDNVSGLPSDQGSTCIEPNTYFTQTSTLSISSYSNPIAARIVWGSNNYVNACVSNAFDFNKAFDMLQKCGDHTCSAAQGENETSCPADCKDGENGLVNLTLKNGFNAIYIPANQQAVLTKRLKDLGMTVFAFNRTGQKTWDTTFTSFYHGVGYYVLNPGGNRTVSILDAATETGNERYLTKGWNLLANPSSLNLKLADTSYYVDPSCTGKTEVDCAKSATATTLKSLLEGDRYTQRAYATIWVINDPYATSADVAFQKITVTSANLDTVEIPAGKLFWIYLFN